jgi:hypothetical protein
MIQYKEILVEMVNNLLSGKWSVEEFRNSYYDYFLEEVPEDFLCDKDYEFFARVQEKLDWTSEKPDEESRRYGWLTHAEYVEWLKSYYAAYQKSNA